MLNTCSDIILTFDRDSDFRLERAAFAPVNPTLTDLVRHLDPPTTICDMIRSRIQAPDISFVVARSWPQNIIGCENQLPWRLRGDLKRFREITTGHAVIMGRKTFESIGHPLPNRKNVIISRAAPPAYSNMPIWHDEQEVIWAISRENALFFADIVSFSLQNKDIFVIGGAEIYKLFKDLFYKIYMTVVFTGEIKGDTFFEHDFHGDLEWKMLYEEDFPKTEHDDYPSRFLIYKKKKYNRRFVDPRTYLTYDPAIEKWLEKYRDVVSYDDRKQDATEVSAFLFEPHL